ncbi:hypothetical protein ZWY2020_004820 [Hordeum vulgare]|nr:hypothetical protein ZWY2020_004820 [Hordeum vulgare]
MVVRKLTGGIYFGKPRGFGTNDKGEETGFNTEIYSVVEASMLWRKRVTAIASEFPDVELSHIFTRL